MHRLQWSVPMASIQRFVQITQAFDPEATRVLGQAFDTACALLGHTPQPTAVREAIAKNILELRRRESAIRFACETQGWSHYAKAMQRRRAPRTERDGHSSSLDGQPPDRWRKSGAVSPGPTARQCATAPQMGDAATFIAPGLLVAYLAVGCLLLWVRVVRRDF